MYDSYIMRKKVSLEQGIRTQIVLPAGLKRKIELVAKQRAISLGQFLRESADRALMQAEVRQCEQGKIVDRLIGSVDIDKHHVWRDTDSISQWVNNLRK